MEQLNPQKPSEIKHFIYQNAEGLISYREVFVVSEDDKHVQAKLIDTGETRTFLKSRVLEYIDDPELAESRLNYFKDNVSSELPKQHHVRRVLKTNSTGALEVCFTGFKASDKDQLSKIAEKNGFFIRQSVSEKLSFLVAGDNAGPSKMENARGMGILILNADEFIAMISTGEIPE